MKARILATAATAAALALAPAAAASAAYPPTVITCTINIVITQQGIIFTITCTGFIPTPGATALVTVTSRNPATPDSAISISGTKSAEVPINADGSVNARVAISAPGVYDVTVTAGGVSSTQTVVVPATGTGTAAGGLTSAASGASTAAGGLSATGTDVLPLAGGAAAVLLIGTGAVIVARQRRRETA
ncbi:hypothetical protein [Cellulomonas sp.]|uniref:hypothetical protein n=1 Tax=Cellulomonas sp. TaxID=40001 RepID=UPI001B2D812B|nr:hypothetical protein [Cellulomonas sp.]MBO9553124.1 hypothetical protein [Cellulomonas sp.]